MDAKLLVNATELARQLSISRRHLTRLVARGVIPRPVRLGRCVRWNFDEVLAALQGQRPAETARQDSRQAGDM